MHDLLYLAIVGGFFAVAVALLHACDRIIGPDATASSRTPAAETGAADAPVEVTA